MSCLWEIFYFVSMDRFPPPLPYLDKFNDCTFVHVTVDRQNIGTLVMFVVHNPFVIVHSTLITVFIQWLLLPPKAGTSR